MKKLITTLIVLIVITITANKVNAQTYQPFPTDTPSWDVARCWYLFSAGWYDHYSVKLDGSDTLYDGFLFKKIFIDEHQLHGTFDSIYQTKFFGGIREANKQIFIFQTWATVDTTIHLVYDFNNTTVGDTIYTSCLAGPSTILIGHLITATDSVLVGATYHKRLHLQDPFNTFNTEYWIEGVGSSWGLPFATFWSITDNSYDLTCFYDKQIMYVNPAPVFGFCTPPLPAISCDSVVIPPPPPGSVPEEASEKIVFSLYPNPADDLVTLNINNSQKSNLTVSIYNIMGELVKKENRLKSQTQLHIGDLNKGIYVVVISSIGFVESKKLLIQR